MLLSRALTVARIAVAVRTRWSLDGRVLVMRIAVVGSGFSGLGAAIKLRQAGFDDLVVFERASEIGGTWRDNTYPGCACDIRSHLYSFSFHRNPNWTREFPSQSEIQAYLLDVVAHYDLRPLIEFKVEITEMSWLDERRVWQLMTSTGELREFDVVINATGPLSRPKLPDVPGLDRFGGTMFHSQQWRHDHILAGERVAVVGTGASSIQFVPEIVSLVGHVTVFQRTAPWVLPREDGPISEQTRRWFRRLPILTRIKRGRIWLRQELLFRAFLGKRKPQKQISDGGKLFIRALVLDPETQVKVTPNYVPGCKRLLISNDWYPTLNRENVSLVTAGIVGVTETGVLDADGGHHEVDTIILGTGFAATEFLAPMKVFGRDGRELSEQWRDGAATYLGTAVHGFPNFWMMVGPTTGLGHNSIVLMMEAQLHLIVGALRYQRRLHLRALEVSGSAQRSAYDRHNSRMGRTVWASGCKSWYLSTDGRNDTLWEGTTLEYWWRTRRFKRSDFE